MKIDFSLEDHVLNKLFQRVGFKKTGIKAQIGKVAFTLLVCWLPLAVSTLIQGDFWTGVVSESFITTFDVQVRLLIALPILMLAEKMIGPKLVVILNQFIESGIIKSEDRAAFDANINRKTQFMKSRVVDLIILFLCYVQVVIVIFYEKSLVDLLSWQVVSHEGNATLSFAGYWNFFVCKPFVLFLLYRWLFRIILWGAILRKISTLQLNLYPIHPDLSGGLGFLGYSVRFFSPVAFAISCIFAGVLADLVISGGFHVSDFRAPAIVYLVVITLLFTLPLMAFSSKLTEARERTVFENYDYANGIYRELRKRIAKGYFKVESDDLSSPDFTTAADLNSLLHNALRMKFIPFTVKDLIPVWVAAAIPFIGVIALEVPFAEIVKKVMQFVV